MRLTKDELTARVVQTGLPAAITGRHITEDGDPAGGAFGYFVREESLECMVAFASLLDIMEGTLHVDRMTC